jgi:hypothetical protein
MAEHSNSAESGSFRGSWSVSGLLRTGNFAGATLRFAT